MKQIHLRTFSFFNSVVVVSRTRNHFGTPVLQYFLHRDCEGQAEMILIPRHFYDSKSREDAFSRVTRDTVISYLKAKGYDL